MRVVGLDLSYSATGVAAHDGSTFTISEPDDGDAMARLALLRDRIVAATHCTDLGSGFRCDACDLYGTHPDVVAVEDLPQARIHEPAKLGMLQGVVRLRLYEIGMRVAAIPASSMKLYATGKGNSSKDAVFAEAIRRLGYQGSSKDETDALWLRQMALDHYGVAELKMPAHNRTALVKIAWPELAMEAAS